MADQMTTPKTPRLTDEELDKAYWNDQHVWPRNPGEGHRRVADAASDKAQADYQPLVDAARAIKLQLDEQHDYDCKDQTDWGADEGCGACETLKESGLRDALSGLEGE